MPDIREPLAIVTVLAAPLTSCGELDTLVLLPVMVFGHALSRRFFRLKVVICEPIFPSLFLAEGRSPPEAIGAMADASIIPTGETAALRHKSFPHWHSCFRRNALFNRHPAHFTPGMPMLRIWAV